MAISLKLTVIGGGSTYTPELVDGIARLRAALPVDELALVDPDRDRLEVVGAMARRQLARHGHPARVVTTADLDAGADGAGAVLVQLRVGGQAARAGDERFPLDCGCVGQETTGAGGLAKALRTVPVVLDVVARAAARAAPGAWVVDFTNPVGIVTRALLDAGHRAVGLCNVAIDVQRRLATLLGVAPERVALDHAGLNHLTWVRAAHLDGADVLGRLLAERGEELAAIATLPPALLRRLRLLPSSYLRYYYEHDQVAAEQRAGPTRAERVAAIERELLDRYADPTVDAPPALLARRGGAWYSLAAVRLLAALAGDQGETHVVNTHNHGALPFLPDGAVVEVPARVTAAGPVPLPVRPLEPLLAGLVAHVAAYEELALDAALHGGRARVERALLVHPLVGQADLAERLTDRLLATGARHLPWTACP